MLNTVQEIIALVTGLCGLVSAGIGAYFAIKNWIAVTKNKNAQEIWAMIMEIADTAMKEAEKSCKTGADKKTMVIDTVKASCKAAGLDLDSFIDQLSDYIDQTINFVNAMSKKTTC